MCKIKKSVLFFTMFLCMHTVYAQDMELKLSTKNEPRRSWSEFNKAERYHSRFLLGGGYRYESFMNPRYFDNEKQGLLKSNGGYELGLFVNLAPVMLDLLYFGSYFDVNSPDYYAGEAVDRTLHQGMEAFASWMLFIPDWGKFSETVVPYAGIGIITSSIKSEGEKPSEKGNRPLFGSYGITQPLWKCGVMISYKWFFVKGEYKQTLPASNPEAFRAWSIAAGFKLDYK